MGLLQRLHRFDTPHGCNHRMPLGQYFFREGESETAGRAGNEPLLICHDAALLTNNERVLAQ